MFVCENDFIAIFASKTGVGWVCFVGMFNLTVMGMSVLYNELGEIIVDILSGSIRAASRASATNLLQNVYLLCGKLFLFHGEMHPIMSMALNCCLAIKFLLHTSYAICICSLEAGMFNTVYASPKLVRLLKHTVEPM